MDPMKKGREHFGRSAQKMLNLSLSLLADSSPKSPEFVESCLSDAIDSAAFSKSGGNTPERIDAMKKQFSNTLRLMKRNDVEVTKESMISVFRSSLDESASNVLDESLSPENQSLINDSMEVSGSKSETRKSFDNSGPSI